MVFQLVKHVLNVKIEEGVQLKHQSEEVRECNLLVFLGLVRGPKVLKIKQTFNKTDNYYSKD